MVTRALIRFVRHFAFIGALAVPSLVFAQADVQLFAVFSTERQTAGQPGFIVNTNALPPMPDPACCNFGGTTVTAGRRIQFDVTASNLGPNTAAAVIIHCVLPIGCTVIENTLTASPGGGSQIGRCVVLPQTVTDRQEVSCNYPDLANGQSAAARFQMLVDPSIPAGTQMSMDAFVTSSTADPNHSNNLASIQFDAQPFSDFEISTKVDPIQVVAGEQAHHRITIKNLGPSTAHGLTLLNALTEGGQFLQLARANILGGAGDCYQDFFIVPGINCDFGEVAPGQLLTIDLDLDVDSSTPDLLDFVNNVSLAGGPVIQIRAVQDVTETITATTESDIEVFSAALNPVVVAGEHVFFDIVVTNLGSSDAQDVTITQVLPDLLTYVADDIGGFEAAPGTLVIELGTLPAGQSRSVLVLAAVASDADDGVLIEAVATVSTATIDPDGDNNSAKAIAVVDVVPPPVINVESPVVNVEPPVVNVEPPVVNVEAPSPVPTGGACGTASMQALSLSMIGLLTGSRWRRRIKR